MPRDDQMKWKAPTSTEPGLWPISDDLPALLRRCLVTTCILAGIAAAGCGIVAGSPRTGSETHFLAPCAGECAAGLECLAGICTLPCAGDAECSSLDAAATCRTSGTAEPDSCQVACSSDDQCGARDAAWKCDTGRCVAQDAFGLAIAGASPFPARCIPSGPFPPLSEVQTTAETVSATTSVSLAVGDEQGLYWIENDGSVLSLPSGSSSSVTLRAANDVTTFFTGIVAGEERVYWVEGSQAARFGVDLPGDTAARIFSVPKLGGPVEISTESNEISQPLGIAGSNLIVVTREDYQVQALEAGSLRALDHVRSQNIPELVDGALYWLEWSEDPNRTDVFSATVAPGPVQRRASFEGSDLVPITGTGSTRFEAIITPGYLFGPGFFLSIPPHNLVNPAPWVPSLRHVDLETGCTTELPVPDEANSSLLLDGQYVYWLSSNPNDDLQLSDPALYLQTPQTLMRLNLTSFAIQRVVIPGFELRLGAALVAKDGRNLYLGVGGSSPLVAIRKPE